jgi:hypothetical protein
MNSLHLHKRNPKWPYICWTLGLCDVGLNVAGPSPNTGTCDVVCDVAGPIPCDVVCDVAGPNTYNFTYKFKLNILDKILTKHVDFASTNSPLAIAWICLQIFDFSLSIFQHLSSL